MMSPRYSIIYRIFDSKCETPENEQLSCHPQIDQSPVGLWSVRGISMTFCSKPVKESGYRGLMSKNGGIAQ